MSETSKIPEPDPDDEAAGRDETDALDDLLDEELEPDQGDQLPPHGDIWDPINDDE